ncbi:putative GDSL lipase/esterase, SGNH hydrolase superfamily [Helianthus debilis subsp. tardiflorus]
MYIPGKYCPMHLLPAVNILAPLIYSNANLFAGFTDPLGRCLRKDGSVLKACANPLEYISWDGVHHTEAANKWVASHIQDGAVSAPKTPLTEACRPVSGSHR